MVEPVPGHFVERHGLMLLIALGESVLAIGVGLGTGVSAIGVEQIAFAAISLLLAATLFWAYFGVGEDHRAEAVLDTLPPARAQAAALASYGYAFYVVLFGIVLTAAGLHHALVHPSERLTWEYAGQLCVGVGGFWVGLGLFRLTLGLSGARTRIAGGVALGAVIVVGADSAVSRAPDRPSGGGVGGAHQTVSRPGRADADHSHGGERGAGEPHGRRNSYPTRGVRGVGPALARASRWNQVAEYLARSDEEMCVLVQVESVKALPISNPSRRWTAWMACSSAPRISRPPWGCSGSREIRRCEPRSRRASPR